MKAKKPVVLSPLDYERTARLLSDRKLVEMEAAQIVQRQRERVREVQAACEAHMARLQRKHASLAGVTGFTMDDATRTLHPAPVADGVTG